MKRDTNHFVEKVRRRARLRHRARQRAGESIWMNLSKLGAVGWTVALPVVLGAALGIWLDSRFPDHVSWTVMLIFLGLLIGCLQAWTWISQQSEVDEEEEEADDAHQHG